MPSHAIPLRDRQPNPSAWAGKQGVNHDHKQSNWLHDHRVCGAAPSLAQTAPPAPEHVPLQKTIGQAGPDIVPSLIVMNARGASLQGGKLTLTGVAPNSIVFADRPVRAAGHSLTTDLLHEWSPSNDSADSFSKDPPNATVSVFSTDGSKVRDAVVVAEDSEA